MRIYFHAAGHDSKGALHASRSSLAVIPPVGSHELLAADPSAVSTKQPAQQSELAFVVGMNISGLIFITWISGEIAVIVAQLGAKDLELQDAIDTVNTAMINANLSLELQ